ncbi:MAG: serine/threonine protein kinase, partial [Myxococcales bacterium]|nr:serine/threonine protein kinase [Myxococcales bacterium]
GRVFIAMELVDGVTLDRWCALTKPSLERVLDVFRQAGRGLSVAHASGLVHRDFKPQNLLVTTDERVLVTDFGLAFSSQDGAREIAGTPAYMAPEQRRGEASALSDQYGFALCLAEALGASLPAPGAVPELPSRIPDWLRAVLRRALSADPAQRYPSMDPLLADLRGGRGVTASAHVTANALLLGGLTLLHAFWLLVMVWAGVKLWLDPSILDSALEGDAMEETAPAIEGEAQLDEELDEELEEPVEEPLTFTDAAILTYAAYWAVWTALGLLWAPISGLGLSRRKAWARVSTMLYAAFTGFSVLGLPYSGYALYSLSRPDVVGLFADVGAPKSAQEGPVVKGQAHLTINVLAQLGLWLLHLGLFALTLELLRFGSEEGTPETPPIIVVSLVAHGLGIFWAPLNAWGLSKRAAWARWSSMAYGLCTAFTGVGLPYALYAWISLSSASVKARFAETV